MKTCFQGVHRDEESLNQSDYTPANSGYNPAGLGILCGPVAIGIAHSTTLSECFTPRDGFHYAV